jgi:hypothetical protein
MNRSADLSLKDFRRLPGFYRRWELTEVCEPNRNYQIEDAGTHADGTPLLAIYVAEAAGRREYISAPRHFDDGAGRCQA